VASDASLRLRARESDEAPAGIVRSFEHPCSLRRVKAICHPHNGLGASSSCRTIGDRSSQRFSKSGGGPPRSKRRGVFWSARSPLPLFAPASQAAPLRVVGCLVIGRPSDSPKAVEDPALQKARCFLECSRMRDPLPLFAPASQAAPATRRSAPNGLSSAHIPGENPGENR
jgi:hypothetical protein